MMNRYLKNLNKIEFVITNACTGKCKHCSEGDHTARGAHIDPTVAADAVRKIAAAYDVKTVMTFGGEPLLYPESVCSIMRAATELNIPRRQVITNGFFAKNINTVRAVTKHLAESGVNNLLLSVDAFHQETIPLDAVRNFAIEAKKCSIPIRLQPAWLIGPTNDNPYNVKTHEILDSFADLGIFENEGNVIFPEGNAKKYLAEYFVDTLIKNPYVDDPHDVRCASFSPNGDLFGGNVYKQDVMEILKNYTP